MSKVFIRLNTSNQLGTGHFRRMTVLADKLDRQCVFYVRADDITTKWLTSRPETVVLLESEAEFVSAVEAEKPALIIFDLLDYPPDFLSSLEKFNVPLVTFHEKELGVSKSDLAINYNPIHASKMKTEPDVEACLGTAYAIFNDEFVRLRDSELKKENAVLITMGGADPSGLTVRIAEQIQSLCQENEWNVLIHTGPAFQKGAYQKRLEDLQKYGNVDWIHCPDNLAGLMARAKLAITAGGNTMYEFCLLGVGALVVAHNDHQKRFARVLHDQQVVEFLGEREPSNLTARVRFYIENPNELADLSKRAGMAFDGRGVLRVADKIEAQLNREHGKV